MSTQDSTGLKQFRDLRQLVSERQQSTPEQSEAQAQAEAARAEARRREPAWLISNLIPRSVYLSHADQKKLIPPFGTLEISQAEFEDFELDEWTSMGILEKAPISTAKTSTFEMLGLVWAAALVYGGLVYGIWRLLALFTSNSPPADFWVNTGYLALFVSGAVLAYQGFDRQRLTAAAQTLKHSVGAILQLGVSFGVPFVAITADLASSASTGTFAPNTISLFGFELQFISDKLIGPILQVLLIGVLSGLPALLFYLFDRQRLSTLRESFFRSIVLLVPSIHTLKDAESVFGLRAEAVLGNSDTRGGSRFLPHNRTIIFVTTIIVAIGWTITLAPTSSASQLTDYLTPTPSPMAYAFLGAYTFGIGMLFRRYARSDIKPSAYAHFTIRTITAVIIAWAATLAIPENQTALLLMVAFLIGFFPDTGLMAIAEYVKNTKFIKMRVPSITEKFPLERLDGINIYHRARLIDEGIENMENLAHADLIELMLQTRIPLATLIDWIDQSILYLHVAADTDKVDEDIIKLREYGLRTATDLEIAAKAARKRTELDEFLSLLNPGEPVSRLRTILDALLDDEWMETVRVWRQTRYPTDVLTCPDDLAAAGQKDYETEQT